MAARPINSQTNSVAWSADLRKLRTSTHWCFQLVPMRCSLNDRIRSQWNRSGLKHIHYTEACHKCASSPLVYYNLNFETNLYFIFSCPCPKERGQDNCQGGKKLKNYSLIGKFSLIRKVILINVSDLQPSTILFLGRACKSTAIFELQFSFMMSSLQ
jgi:hypothetical protein